MWNSLTEKVYEGGMDTFTEEELKTKMKDSWEKEFFYLTTHSTHFIYGYMAQTYGREPLR